MQSARAGVLAMVTSCTVWGLSPLYYKLLAHVPPLEVLSHRTLWSAVFFTVVLLFQGRLGRLRDALGSLHSVVILGFAALMISANWFMFIFSVQNGHTTEASLGYYIYPLVAVLLGVVAFGERLGRVQIFAVALAATAVVVLSVASGVAPWISLLIALTFGLYSLVKKRVTVGPLVSVTAEVMLLSPLALGWLWHTHNGAGGAFGEDFATTALLMFSGLLTAVPLILFTYAAQRVTLTTIGLVQYLNPTLQFFCAVVIFGEAFGMVDAVAFGLIWTALGFYSAASMRQESARRKASRTAAAVPSL
ncbi:EamA family transporter RarD [Puniceibacterium sediminis]|uniref:Chloramphenicol-sensitive protein RarD n=1 Tax=Puniceibacterium sediminis TaxID=1608407 RepID=A0A238V073_9RHOB|nr:EamA family transporter RarD [Puniceibacterium sediminis]SNR26929.1 chloramphenicol-sensitive protein RarD [Puniceibacterium sediminis]